MAEAFPSYSRSFQEGKTATAPATRRRRRLRRRVRREAHAQPPRLAAHALDRTVLGELRRQRRLLLGRHNVVAVDEHHQLAVDPGGPLRDRRWRTTVVPIADAYTSPMQPSATLKPFASSALRGRCGRDPKSQSSPQYARRADGLGSGASWRGTHRSRPGDRASPSRM